MIVPDFITARRSVRQFRDEAIPNSILDACINAACYAPAPHHTRPWRWIVVTTAAHKAALATAMGNRWLEDLTRDGMASNDAERLVARSYVRLTETPALIIGALTRTDLDVYPDEARNAAEWGMAVLSLGAAVENLMLSATDAGLASCWVAAPIFCPDVVQTALALDPTWIPQALVCVGYPNDAIPGPRPPIDLDALRVWR